MLVAFHMVGRSWWTRSVGA